MSDEKICSRRSFLNYLITITGCMTVLTTISSDIKAEQKKPVNLDDQPKPLAKGYQRTKHVDTYYSLADL